MKVIEIDNYGRDYRPDSQITVAGLHESLCELIASSLNASKWGGGDRYYKVVSDDYCLNYEDMDDCNGEIKERESFLRSRDYIGLPKVAQDALYLEYIASYCVGKTEEQQEALRQKYLGL